MSTSKSIAEINRELGEVVLADAKRDPSKYAGKFIGIANGAVICSGNDLNLVILRLEQEESDPMRTYFVDTSRDHTKVLEIW